MSDKNHKRSRLARGEPLRERAGTFGDIEVIAEEALDGCTCSPIFHFHDAGPCDGLAILHDSRCERLINLKSQRN